ncbi:MAG TPA: APC family permease [Opitutales bacterium]|jgi:amino acid transporter|nr:APC family permease [Opitutales bacterium]
MNSKKSVTRLFKDTIIGKERHLTEEGLFHKISLVTLLAWVGLGADGLSSACYGPEEAFKALLDYPHLVLFVALMTTLTIVIICASYSQIISLFPSGGGGYVVASRLLSPTFGVISGSALLIDYVLTISTSVAAGNDALFSFFPDTWQRWKVLLEILGILFLVMLNLRGVRESVTVLLPVFFLFLLTHGFMIIYGFFVHSHELFALGSDTAQSIHEASSKIGMFGILGLLMGAYSKGAGTYTGIEAVSNGLAVLREPRVRTGRRTMILMGLSLAGMVGGLLIGYLLVNAVPVPDKPLNWVLMTSLTQSWGSAGGVFVVIAMLSAAALLFIAAQTGFLDGPRVLSNMALDRWMPNRFAALSDRYVTLWGILIMGFSAATCLWLTGGSVDLLVTLYAINVFITFTLSQLGMVRHWWQVRKETTGWRHRLAINAVGMTLTSIILVMMVVTKFREGGWVTLTVTAVLVGVAFLVRRHYDAVRRQLKRMDFILEAAMIPPQPGAKDFAPTSQRTAVFLVNGFNGLGLHTLFGAARLFGGGFKRIIFVSVGVVDAGNFKGSAELENLKAHVKEEGDKYVHFITARGGQAETYAAIGHDVLDELEKILPDLMDKYPNAVFFSGQLVFEKETIITRLLHNYTAFAIQRRLFLHGLPCAIIPMRVENAPGEAPKPRAPTPPTAPAPSASPA